MGNSSAYDGNDTLTISGLEVDTDVMASSLISGGFNTFFASEYDGKLYGAGYYDFVNESSGHFTVSEGIVAGESDDSTEAFQVLVNGSWLEGEVKITTSSTNSLQLDGLFTPTLGGSTVSLGSITAKSAEISGRSIGVIVESEFDAYLDTSTYSTGAKVYAASINNVGGIYSRTIGENYTAYINGCSSSCTISQVSDLINPSNDFSSIVNNSQTSKTSFNDGYSGTYKSVSNYFDFAFFDNGKVLVWDGWGSEDVYILNYSRKTVGGESILEITDSIDLFNDDGYIPFVFISKLDGYTEVFVGDKSLAYTEKVIAVNSIARQDLLKSFQAKSVTHPNLFDQTASW